jgi:chromosome segregation ATPase
MTEKIVIVILLLLVIYLYYQNRKRPYRLNSSNSDRTLFSFQEELQEENKELKSALDQALALQTANQQKMTEQAQEISNLKNRLNVYGGIGASSSGEDGKLKAVLNERDELKRTNQNLELDNEKLTEDLNSILTEWKFGNKPITSAADFLNKFKPWIEKNQKEVEELKEKVKELAEDKETGEELETLEAERDEAIRDKKTLEQEVLAINNRLNLKQQEVKNQEEARERLKKEFSEKDKSLNKQIKEWKEKYSKQSKLLDEEQTDNNKLNKKIEQLETKITELTRPKSPMPGEFPEDDKQELIKKHQEQLRKINLLFDEQATNYETIDFNGLYSLLEEEAKKKTSRPTSHFQQTEKKGQEINSLDDFINWINRDETN